MRQMSEEERKSVESVIKGISLETKEQFEEFKRWIIKYLCPYFDDADEDSEKFSKDITDADARSIIDLKNICMNYCSNEAFPSWERIIIDWSARENADKKPEIRLPGLGKLISDFAEQAAHAVKDKNAMFFRIDSREIVEIGKIKLHKNGEEVYTGFLAVKPNKFITLAEKYMVPGIKVWDDSDKCWEFKKKSMGADLANTLLCSEIMQQALPQINRIFTIPVPIMHEGRLTFPKKGYDKRFYSWLPYNSPKISDPHMSLEDAKKIIYYMLKEFCFKTRQDYTNAVAAILTPYLRGIFPSFNTRTPVFFYLANRERAGKDYLAGISGIIYEGHTLEESPISSSEEKKVNSSEELRKKILAAMIGGRKRMHFSNNKGFIDNAVFESVITAEKYSDRILGKSEILTFDNELDFSLSGNTGVGFTPDFANRCRFIRLFLEIEDANSRKFDNPDLHNWVRENRGVILSALFSLVRNWISKGMRLGDTPFTSFQHWAAICGGIMEAAGYDSPCAPDKEITLLGGDSETIEMKQLFEICYDKVPDMWITKKDIKEIIRMEDEGLMAYLDFSSRADQIKFGNKIIKFIGRVFSDICLVVKDPKIRSARQEYKFTKEIHEIDKNMVFGEKESLNELLDPKFGNVGNIGNDFSHSRKMVYSIVYGQKLLPALPTLPKNGILPGKEGGEVEDRFSFKSSEIEVEKIEAAGSSTSSKSQAESEQPPEIIGSPNNEEIVPDDSLNSTLDEGDLISRPSEAEKAVEDYYSAEDREKWEEKERARQRAREREEDGV